MSRARGPGVTRPLATARKLSYVTEHVTREVREETLRRIGVAFIGMAVAISMVDLGVTEPAVAQVRERL
jgi:hypothetical protein